MVRDGLTGMFADEPGVLVVGEAGDGLEALVVIGRCDPDVVLMDLRMPGGDGVPAIRELRRRSRTRPKVLVLTTYDTDRDVRSAIEPSATAISSRTLGGRTWSARCTTWLAGRPVLVPSALAVLSSDRTRPRSVPARRTCCGWSPRGSPTERSPVGC